MGIPSEITSLGQDIDVDSGEVMNRITLHFTDDSQIQAIITDASAKKIVALIAQSRGVPSPEPEPRTDPVIFGGDMQEEPDAPTETGTELFADVDEDGVGSV